jgi:hypothetical protein
MEGGKEISLKLGELRGAKRDDLSNGWRGVSSCFDKDIPYNFLRLSDRRDDLNHLLSLLGSAISKSLPQLRHRPFAKRHNLNLRFALK